MQNHEFSRILGDTVRHAREKSSLTQEQLASDIGIQARTILNIENHHGNPKLEVLYPLIRSLKIDPCCIFYPESQQDSPALRQLQILISDCSEEEAVLLASVIEALLTTYRDSKAGKIQ
ncbi:MAG: helix-turn-helix domain-containing protein [Lachnospiraceae bacterium]|nr:helix-turn-helix domain-containing protein [Lachnospiraceae bacterium]